VTAEAVIRCRILLTTVFLGMSVIGLGTTPETAAAFQQVCADLRAVTRAQAEFTEEKTLQILSHPLQSKGTLLFSPQDGVYRVQREPLHQEMLITRSQLVQKDAQGVVHRMSVRGQPAAQAFVDVFLSFFAGDQRAWEKNFEAAFAGIEENWKIVFTPRRKSPVAKALRRIVLEGRQGTLHRMTITEANGDETRTVYTHQQVWMGPVDPTAIPFPNDLSAS
jgi:hypothetical protein